MTVGQRVARLQGSFYRVGVVQKVNEFYDLYLVQYDDNTPARWNALKHLSLVEKA